MFVIKPWGHYKQLTQNETTTVKIISLHAGKRTSLQRHQKRSEKWYIIEGKAIATMNSNQTLLSGEEIFIPKQQVHRLLAVTDLVLLEISYGEFDEADIERLDGDYSR
jgi:mannose-6-phosphate isomerase